MSRSGGLKPLSEGGEAGAKEAVVLLLLFSAAAECELVESAETAVTEVDV